MNIMILDAGAIDRNDLDYSEIKRLGNVIIKQGTKQENLITVAKDAEAVLTNRLVFNRDTIEKMPNLKYIGLFATGYNGVDLAAATERGITVTNVPGYSTDSVAQMTFALMLELCNKTGEYSRLIKSGEWNKMGAPFMFSFPLCELAGKTIGIVGFGDIGIKVAEIAKAFSMKVLVYSRTKKVQYECENLKFVSLEQLFEQSDFVTLHVPLTDKTKNLINQEAFLKMKKMAVLINTARGGIVDQEALIYAIENKLIAGAALDVMTPEPLPSDSKLFKFENIVLTPHIGWATIESRERLLKTVGENLKAFIDGNPQNKVNR